MAVQPDGALAVHPLEMEPERASGPDLRGLERSRIEEVTVVAALVHTVGVVPEVGIRLHAGGNIRGEDAARDDGLDRGQAGRLRHGADLPADVAAAAVECDARLCAEGPRREQGEAEKQLESFCHVVRMFFTKPAGPPRRGRSRPYGVIRRRRASSLRASPPHPCRCRRHAPSCRRGRSRGGRSRRCPRG